MRLHSSRLRDLLAASGSVIDLRPAASLPAPEPPLAVVGRDWQAVEDDLRAAFATHPPHAGAAEPERDDIDASAPSGALLAALEN